jgi:thiamine-phosphate pyrophosphorylase
MIPAKKRSGSRTGPGPPGFFPGFRLYVITDLKLFHAQAEMLERIGYFLKSAPGGSAGVCLREHGLYDRDLFALANKLRRMTRRHGSALLVNRRVDLALLCGADGVHLGSKTMSIRDARALMRSGLIGYSAHSSREAAAAFRSGASFVTISPVFHSPGKGAPLGLEGLGRTVAACRGRPVFALGGIDASNISRVFARGAAGAAFIRAALEETGPSRLIRAMPPQ